MANSNLLRMGNPRVYCERWELACAFYGEVLGLSLVERDDARGRALFQLAGGWLLLERVSDPRPDAVDGRRMGLSFEVANLAQAHAALATAGVHFLGDVCGEPGGAQTIDFADPDGNVWTLCEPAPAPRTEEQQAGFDAIASGGRGGFGGPFLAWGQHRCLPRLIDAMGAYFLREGTLPPRLRELAIITTGRVWTAQIEWYAHVPAARRAGISADVVEAIAQRREPPFERSDEAAVYHFAIELAQTRRVSDATFATLQRELGVEQRVELVALLGFYTMTAMALNTYELRPPASATRLLPP